MDSQGTTSLVRSNSGLPEERAAAMSRFAMLRELFSFQLKLFLDGMKDLFLSPLSMAVAVVGLISPKLGVRGWDYLYALGRRLDRFIDLFPEGNGDGRGDTVADVIVHAQRTLAKLRARANPNPQQTAEVDRILRELTDLALRAPSSGPSADKAKPST